MLRMINLTENIITELILKKDERDGRGNKLKKEGGKKVRRS